MCGIMAFLGEKNAKKEVFEALKKLEYRGYDSAGIAFFDEGQKRIVIHKQEGRVERLADELSLEDGCRLALGHTRWATHGEPSALNSHPHRAGRVVLVHNGIIENYRELARELEASSGKKPVSDTDSEIAAMLIEEGLERGLAPTEALKRAAEKMDGAFAVALLLEDRPGEFYCLRRQAALLLGQDGEQAAASSDLLGLGALGRRYFKMPEESIARVSRDGIELYDFSLRPLQPSWREAAPDASESGRMHFDFYMEKEIYDEPEALHATLESRIKEGRLDLGADGMDENFFRDIDEIVITACGTAYYAGLAGRIWLEKFARIPCRVEIASEFRYGEKLVGPRTLLIAVSQSGETADTLASFAAGRAEGARTLAVVNVRDSALTEEADAVFYTLAGPELAVASTKAYSCQLMALYMIALYAAECRGRLSPGEARHELGLLRRVPVMLQGLLAEHQALLPIAEKLMAHDKVFFLGRGLDYCLALEGALKLKEISYIYAEAYAAGEMKHGTISLITEGLPCIAIAAQQALQAKMRSNIREIRSRGADVILLAEPGFADEAGLDGLRISLPACEDRLSPFFAACCLQLLAYYVSRGKGLDVDRPRNLAKSVTVE